MFSKIENNWRKLSRYYSNNGLQIVQVKLSHTYDNRSGFCSNGSYTRIVALEYDFTMQCANGKLEYTWPYFRSKMFKNRSRTKIIASAWKDSRATFKIDRIWRGCFQFNTNSNWAIVRIKTRSWIVFILLSNFWVRTVNRYENRIS